MRRRRLPLRHAVALGALHGPAELLPVSSSGHLVLVPALLGWPYAGLPADVRKSFEVALHAGTAAALVLVWRRDIPGPAEAALLTAPAAAAGLALERPIEGRLSSPRVAAVAQIVAGAVLALSQRRLGAPSGGPAAGVSPPVLAAIGLAQAAALVPGVSRGGATLTAGALLGLDRAAAARVSRSAALPVLAAAGALKGWRLARGGLPRELRRPFAAGAAAAFATTLATAPLGRLPARGSWLPWAAWRVALGAAALRRPQALEWHP